MGAFWNARTLAQRLGIGFGALLALMSVLALTGFVGTRVIQASVKDIFEVRLPAIRQIATDLRGGAQQVVAAATEVSGSAQQLSRGASDQAAALEETSAAMEEMASMTRRRSRSSRS